MVLRFRVLLRFLIVPIFGALLIHSQGVCNTVPFVKEWTPTSDTLTLRAAARAPVAEVLQNEAKTLKSVLGEAGIAIKDDGTPIRLEVGKVSIPDLHSRYADAIRNQAYRVVVTPSEIRIQSPTPAGVFYGIQTLGQMLAEGPKLGCGEVVDWPDIPVRMIMVDPARQNENFGYYKRVIDFAGRWKLNGILCHLTDDETACLYQPDYKPLMHPHAWRAEDIRDLVAYASARHITLTPEIESLGHSRMFTRLPDFRDILHQTRGERTESWMGTNVPGYTNVLCPASDKTYEYLNKMYTAAAAAFPSPVIHIGCDEVDETSCARCEKKFGHITKSEWFRRHLLRCREIAASHGKKIALWGDMLLKYPDILDGFPTDGVTIYDWHYTPDVSPSSASFFTDRGYEVIACPALMCAPHMVYPDAHNYENIRRFAEIARKQDLLGINTTIWIPQRYMSDVLWPGIAYAAAQSWGGSQLTGDPNVPFALFCGDFLGSPEGKAFESAWVSLSKIIWHRADFLTSCWSDDKSLAEARDLIQKRGDDVAADRAKLRSILIQLTRIGLSVRKHREAWDTMERSAVILDTALDHLQSAPEVKTEKGWNYKRVRELDQQSVRDLGWIEADWNRNRYPDDPDKDGRYQPNQHLLHRFKLMHAFHEHILSTESKEAHSP